MSTANSIHVEANQPLVNSQYLLPIYLLLFAFILVFIYGLSGHDDSHITYSTAKNFAESGQILSTNGERVEQGSSLLHVLLLGGLSKLISVEPASIGQFFSVFFAVLCLLMMPKLCRALGVNPAIALPMMILSVSFSYWAVGGLETPLYTFTILFIVFSTFNLLSASTRVLATVKDWKLWLGTGLCLLSRPEALFFLIAAAVGFGILSFRQWQTTKGLIVGWLIIIAILSAGLFAFRFVYFDALFPQPVYAKSAGLNLEKIAFGFVYFAWSAQLSIIIFSLFTIIAGLRLFLGKST